MLKLPGCAGSYAGTPRIVSVPALLLGADVCWCCGSPHRSLAGSSLSPSQWVWLHNLSSRRFCLGLFSLFFESGHGLTLSRLEEGLLSTGLCVSLGKGLGPDPLSCASEMADGGTSSCF